MAYFTDYFSGYFDSGGEPPAVVTPAQEQPSGGYGWQNEYNAELQRLLRRKFKQEDDEQAVEAALESAGVEIPQADDLTRLRTMVEAFGSDTDALARKTQRAIEYAQRAQTLLAYELAIREIAKQLEDEEHAVLMTLAML